METIVNGFVNCHSYSSYPTYEEWKLKLVIDYILKYSSSYPTYEEWKHNANEKEKKLLYKFLSYL